jgi:hypothetical protein
MKKLPSFALALLALSLAACTWVDLTPEGEKVRVLSSSEVSSCKHLGKTSAMTAAKVTGLARHEHKVEEELNTLARNSAVSLGGDTVVAVGSPVDGRQVFEVYRCIP